MFGCGGNRDKDKRAEMGKIAGENADFSIITSDNPRFEEPYSIIRQIEKGIREVTLKYITIQNRYMATGYAISKLNEGDVLIGISTSGTSKNVVAAVELAKTKGIYCVGMTAANGAKMAELCDECIAVPAKVTARAQEMHILIGHILCELVDGE